MARWAEVCRLHTKEPTPLGSNARQLGRRTRLPDRGGPV